MKVHIEFLTTYFSSFRAELIIPNLACDRESYNNLYSWNIRFYA